MSNPTLPNHWRNWAGNVTASPKHLEYPQTEAQLCDLVRVRGTQGLRAVGSGHSFAPLCVTAATLVSLDRMQGVVEADSATGIARFKAGTKISQIGKPLLDAGLALANQGDIDYQALAGAVSTGTHGTGLRYGSISATVTELRLVMASGEVVVCSRTQESQLFQAARVALGLLGVISEVSLQTVPAYRLHERSWTASLEQTIDQLESAIQGNDHFEFLWLPGLDASAMKVLNVTGAEPFGEPITHLPPPGTLERYVLPERVDWSYKVYPSVRTVPFVEMEYAVPLEQGLECFLELRQLIIKKHPYVRWAVEYRTQQADDIWLSPAFGRDVATLSVHQAPDQPYEAFFHDAEAVFRNHQGRPHWGKVYYLQSRDFAAIYPRWNDFLRLREQFDPKGVFLNDFLSPLFMP